MSVYETHGLGFAIEERPAWRVPNDLTTSVMLTRITEFERAYRAFPKDTHAAKWMHSTYVPTQTVEFVLGSNILEHVGTQEWKATQDALQAQLEIDGALSFLRPKDSDGAPAESDSESAYKPDRDLPKEEVDAMTPAAEERRDHAIRETRQTLAAMQTLRKFHDESLLELQAASAQREAWDTKKQSPIRLEEAHMLTPGVLLDAHKSLMDGLLSKHSKTVAGTSTPVLPGSLRSAEVMAGSVLFKGYLHNYLPSTYVEGHLFQLIDAYNHFCAEMPSTDEPFLRTELCFKISAKLVYEFMTIHPFPNGNGRMAQLLACRALAPVCPFPVLMHPIMKPNQIVHLPVEVKRPGGLTDHFTVELPTARSVYIAAIESAWFHATRKGQPTLLAAMLIENGYQLWSSAFDQMQQIGLIDNQLVAVE